MNSEYSINPTSFTSVITSPSLLTIWLNNTTLFTSIVTLFKIVTGDYTGGLLSDDELFVLFDDSGLFYLTFE